MVCWVGGGGGLVLPFETQDEEMTARVGAEFNGYAHAFAGMGVQFVLMTAVELGVGLLLERQRGLWRRLRSAPFPREWLLWSRMVSGVVITSGTLGGAFVVAMLFFGVRVYGSWVGFLGFVAGTGMLASSLGLVLAAFGGTPSATKGLAIPVILLLLMLSGAWVPAFIFPDWLQVAGKVLPTRWAIDGLNAMTWRGLGLGEALPGIGLLVGVSVVLTWVAVRRFRWDGD